MDRVTPETRSKIMAAVGTKNTGAEMAVRSLIHRLGYRYSLRRKDLPGKPDLVFVNRKKVIFVHGCFWHGHNCKKGKTLPLRNFEYWQEKLSKNKIRDKKVKSHLENLGWKVIIIWECQTKDSEFILKIVSSELNSKGKDESN